MCILFSVTPLRTQRLTPSCHPQKLWPWHLLEDNYCHIGLAFHRSVGKNFYVDKRNHTKRWLNVHVDFEHSNIHDQPCIRPFVWGLICLYTMMCEQPLLFAHHYIQANKASDEWSYTRLIMDVCIVWHLLLAFILALFASCRKIDGISVFWVWKRLFFPNSFILDSILLEINQIQCTKFK